MRKFLSVLAAALLSGCASIAGAGSLADVTVINRSTGERMYAPTWNTEFRRASSAPAEVIAIYYDSRQNLIAQGIIPRYPNLPQPFPNGGFMPDPS